MLGHWVFKQVVLKGWGMRDKDKDKSISQLATKGRCAIKQPHIQILELFLFSLPTGLIWKRI